MIVKEIQTEKAIIRIADDYCLGKTEEEVDVILSDISKIIFNAVNKKRKTV